MGIGHRPTVAAALIEVGVSVTAVDVTEREVPPGVEFVIEDVTDPDLDRYAGAEAIYALRLPPDLQWPVADIAATLDIPLYFTTLGTDPPVVPCEVRTIQEGSVFVHVPKGDAGRAK